MFFSKIPAILIDSENVGSTWTSLLQKDEKFELYICVTENAKSLNFTLLKQLTDEHRYKINIIECKPGKNSLDFYLSSYLGYLIGKNKHSSYTVVSQDTGYDSVIEYWCNEGYDVKRINTKPETVKKPLRRGKKKNDRYPQPGNKPMLPAVKYEPKKYPQNEAKKDGKPFVSNEVRKEENKPAQKTEVRVDSEKRFIVKDPNRDMNQKQPVQNRKEPVAENPKKNPQPVQTPKKQEQPVQAPKKQDQQNQTPRKQEQPAQAPKKQEQTAQLPKKQETSDLNKKNELPKKEERKQEVPKQNEQPSLSKEEKRPAENVKKQPLPAEKKEDVPAAKKQEQLPENKEAVAEKLPETKPQQEAAKKPARRKSKKQPKEDLSLNLLKELLKEIPAEEVEETGKYLNKVPKDKRADKNYIYRGLVRKFKSEKGLSIYSLVKKDLDRYYQLKEQASE